jgi:hypothetical protein
MSRFHRLGLTKISLAGLLSLVGAGCAVSVVSYEADRYSITGGVQVHLACRDTYEVFDRPDAGTMLVTTNALNEGMGLICDEGAAGLPKEERMRRVARLFLDENTNRPDCRITRELPLQPFHTEFSYRCPVPGAPAAPARPAGRKPRG